MLIEIGMLAVRSAARAYRIYRGLSTGDHAPTELDQILGAAGRHGRVHEVAQQDYSPPDTGGADDGDGILDALGDFFEDLFG
ncbi:hypothetical protein GCM10020358_60080 [Amorphoplanes nipponensis]|uniref:Uncharacterized protein n=1 Tax=Actinoplanes nipponensis TaxID=135950 RepID=A0A919MJ81_9ACTN|nr:hypothetical protein [Actinoplanes nipponensis]GIE47181.1 hypothetical protein Ani05nite_07150 [Actinoplanes nipponensis]